LQAHQRGERVDFRPAGRRVRREQARESQRLAHQVRAQQFLASQRGVAFVEREVERFEHRIEAFDELAAARPLEARAAGREPLLRAHQPLRDRAFVREVRSRDLGDVEAADGLQDQRRPRVRRHVWMAAQEHHLERVVGDLVVEHELVALSRARRPRRELVELAVGDLAELSGLAVGPRLASFAPQLVERCVARARDQPCARVARHAGERPRTQRAHQSFLHRLLGELDPPSTEDAHERRRHPSGFGAEEMLDELVRAVGHPPDSSIASMQRSSIVPPYFVCGLPLQSASASSYDSACTRK
jgi:hypothetical protein